MSCVELTNMEMMKKNCTLIEKLEKETDASWLTFEDMELRKLYKEFTMNEVPVFALVIILMVSSMGWMSLLSSIVTEMSMGWTFFVCLCYCLSVLFGFVCSYAIWIFKIDQVKACSPMWTSINEWTVSRLLYCGMATIIMTAIGFGSASLLVDKGNGISISLASVVPLFPQCIVPVALMLHIIVTENKKRFRLQLELADTKAKLAKAETKIKHIESQTIDMHHMIGELSCL